MFALEHLMISLKQFWFQCSGAILIIQTVFLHMYLYTGVISLTDFSLKYEIKCLNLESLTT